MTITYSYKNFGLYQFENIKFRASKRFILNGFKLTYQDVIKQALLNIGIKFMGFKYYSPNTYNFSNDTLDLIISNHVNKALLKKTIINFKDKIQKALDTNKSYDGYMALTVDSVNNELENLKKSFYKIDVLVLTTILNGLVDTSDFDYTEFIEYE